MAETGSEPKRTSKGGTSLLLMIASFLAIGGFLWWLSISAEPTEVAIVEEEEAEEDAGIPTVEVGTFAADPRSYVGQEIRFRNLSVASTLGPEAFWFQLPNETPYLVKLDSSLVAGGTDFQAGEGIRRVVGTVHEMTDSVLDAWQAAEAFTNETQRIEAEFATTFLEARTLDLAGGGGKGGSKGKGSGG